MSELAQYKGNPVQPTRITWGKRTEDYWEFTINGVPFWLVDKNLAAYKTNEERIVVMKSRTFLEAQIARFDALKPERILEVGLYEGGSAILWSLLYDCTFVGIDILERPQLVDTWLEKLDLRGRVHLYYRTSQDNRDVIHQAIGNHFGTKKIDLIIDDASHQYINSRRTFEITFSFLRNGGIYCLEDWSWAHSPGDFWQVQKEWGSNKALSNLVFELMMLHGSVNVFHAIYVLPYVLFCYSSGPSLPPEVSLDSLIAKQDRNFVPM